MDWIIQIASMLFFGFLFWCYMHYTSKDSHAYIHHTYPVDEEETSDESSEE